MDGEIPMQQTNDSMQTASRGTISAGSATTGLATTHLATTGWRSAFVAITLLCVPLAVSAWYQFSETELPILSIQANRPALIFSTYLYHHGEQPIEATSRLRTEFRFRNDGDSPVHIKRVERSCGCMNPMLSSQDVNPGEIASLLVPISTVNQQPGAKEFMLTVHYTDPQPRQANLIIKAVFPEQMVIVEPKALFLSQRTSSKIPFSVRVSDFRDQQLQVTSVVSTSDFVDATLIPSATTALTPIADPVFNEPQFTESSAGLIQQASFDSSEDTSADVQLIDHADSIATPHSTSLATIEGTVAGNLPAGRHHVLVAAETSDPDYPILTIPMMITGPAYPVGQEVQMTSSVIQLVASEETGARRQGQVAFNSPAEWQFAEPQAWPEQLQVTLKTSPTPVPGRASTVVQVALNELPTKQLKEGVISIPTKDGKNWVTVKITFLWP